MDQVTLAKNQMRAENWRDLISACQQIEKNVVNWCQEYGINAKTYYYWLRKLKKQELSGKELPIPVLEAFWCWLDALGRAMTYAKNQKPYMDNYLMDGRCAISNNAAENAIRSFTVEKNWLFADMPKGADAFAAVCSLVETAKTNEINVYTYLQYLLIYMPDINWPNHPKELDDLMPWSETVQAKCKQQPVGWYYTPSSIYFLGTMLLSAYIKNDYHFLYSM